MTPPHYFTSTEQRWDSALREMAVNLGSGGLSLHSSPAFYRPQDTGQLLPDSYFWAGNLHVLCFPFLVPGTKQVVGDS